MNLAAPLAGHARTTPDKPAIVSGDDIITYGALDDLVRRNAGVLRARGLAPGDLVGVALKDHETHLILIYALAAAGLPMLPLDWRWTAEEQGRVARHFGAKLVLIEPDGPRIKDIACVKVDFWWNVSVTAAEPLRDLPVDPATPLLLSLSSGTTGTPKGPMVTHGQFAWRFHTHRVEMNFGRDDRYVTATPFYFGAGRTFAMSMLHVGGTAILFPPPWEPPALIAEIAKREANSLFLVPTLLRRLLDLDDATLAPLKRLRLLVSSGSTLHPEERRAIRERVCAGFIEYYASTEGGGITMLKPADQDRRPDSVGRPIVGVEIEIVDETHAKLPPGAIGRVRYRGPGVATGFHAADSSEQFRDGWFYPGDLAAMDGEGFVTLKGRAKDMIIRGGVNIYPAEIEAILLAHPQVAEAAVVGWPAREFGEEVAAFVVAKGAVTAAALAQHCAAGLASYKRPRDIFIVADMPKNAMGKIVKTKLAETLKPIA